jgi:hypothetical protein
VTISIAVVAGPHTFLACDHVISPRQARGLWRGIEDMSSLRYTLAHENAHLQLESRNPNVTGMTAFLGIFQWLTRVARYGERPQAPSADAVPASARLVQGQITGHGCVGLPGPRLLLAFKEGALPRDNRTALLRLLDGTLAALRLMLVRVLAAFSRHPDALTFALVLLAACLRYGRRGEPDDHAFLPTRRYQTSLGSCPQS